MIDMAVDPVSQRNSMSEAQFKKLSSNDQIRVVNAKMSDQILKPLLDKATARASEARNNMSRALKGEG